MAQLSFRLLPQVARVNLAQLAALSDIVVVAASLSQETNKIVSAEFLANMKSSAFLINISRGGLVDQEALVTALNTDSIAGILSSLLPLLPLHSDNICAGAGLDVCTPEPLPASSPLLACPNVVIFPHIGSATVAAREGMASLAVSNVLALAEDITATMPAEVQL